MLSDGIKLSGALHIVLRDAEGNLKEDFKVNNLVVNTGLAYIASRMKDATAAAISHMGLGTGSTAAGATQTALITPAGARVALDSTTLVTTTVTLDSVQYIATFGAGVATGAIVEAGLFNDLTAGSMLCRTVFAVVNKGALDSMVITWKVTAA